MEGLGRKVARPKRSSYIILTHTVHTYIPTYFSTLSTLSDRVAAVEEEEHKQKKDHKNKEIMRGLLSTIASLSVLSSSVTANVST